MCCTCLCKHAFCYVRRYLEMSSLNKQRVCLKFCFKLGKIFTVTFWDVAESVPCWNYASYYQPRELQKIRGLSNIHRRWPSFGRACSLDWERFYRPSSGFRSFKSSVGSAETGRRMSNVSRGVLYHCKGNTKLALRRSKIHSSRSNALPSVKNFVIEETKKKTL
jgi:hypothetical protein